MKIQLKSMMAMIRIAAMAMPQMRAVYLSHLERDAQNWRRRIARPMAEVRARMMPAQMEVMETYFIRSFTSIMWRISRSSKRLAVPRDVLTLTSSRSASFWK